MTKSVILFDLETAPNLSYHWHGKHEQEIIDIVEEGYILCFSYKLLGGKTKAYSLRDFKGNRKKFIEKLYEVLSQADILVAHNGKNFDFKWANSEFITHGLKPLKPVKYIDTLSIARSNFNFNSNRLNDLGKLLGLGQKIETGGFGLWIGCMKNDKKSWDKMIKYNKADVDLLEAVYNKLIPWMSNYPVTEVGMFCPKCGGNVQFRGPYQNKKFIGKRYQCQKCFSWGVSNKRYKINNEEYVR